MNRTAVRTRASSARSWWTVSHSERVRLISSGKHPDQPGSSRGEEGRKHAQPGAGQGGAELGDEIAALDRSGAARRDLLEEVELREMEQVADIADEAVARRGPRSRRLPGASRR